MKVVLKLYGYPELERQMGGKEVEVETQKRTIGELEQELKEKYGEKVALLFKNQVLKNGTQWIKMNEKHHELKDGDKLMFLNMITGG